MKKHAQDEVIPAVWKGAFLTEAFCGRVFPSQEMANILAQKQLRYIILTVSTYVCQSHCAGER